MSSVGALILAVPLGILQSILAWWIVLRALAPKLGWEEPTIIVRGEGPTEHEEMVFRLPNRGRRRAVDVALLAEIRVDHEISIDGATRTVLRMPLNASWYPAITNGARVRARTRDIPEEDWERLFTRTGKNTRGLRSTLAAHSGAHIRVTALASDQLAGGRMIFDRSNLRLADFTIEVKSDSEWRPEFSRGSQEGTGHLRGRWTRVRKFLERRSEDV